MIILSLRHIQNLLVECVSGSLAGFVILCALTPSVFIVVTTLSKTYSSASFTLFVKILSEYPSSI